MNGTLATCITGEGLYSYELQLRLANFITAEKKKFGIRQGLPHLDYTELIFKSLSSNEDDVNCRNTQLNGDIIVAVVIAV